MCLVKMIKIIWLVVVEEGRMEGGGNGMDWMKEEDGKMGNRSWNENRREE